jgi:hypothetical protein
MRDFLIEKLRGAEIALKASMSESAALKGQADADQEVGDRPALYCGLNHLHDYDSDLSVFYFISLSIDYKLSGFEEPGTRGQERRPFIEVRAASSGLQPPVRLIFT